MQSAVFMLEKGPETPSEIVTIYKSPVSGCITIASLPSVDQQTWCIVTEVQIFNQTVHKMQSWISVSSNKPTMYLNVLLLLNNWENFKVKKRERRLY